MTRKRHPAWARRRLLGAHGSELMEELALALASADEGAIRAVLHPDVVLIIDSGGPVRPASAPLGHATLPVVLLALMESDAAISLASMNGVPGLIIVRADEVVAAVTAEMRSGLLSGIWVVCNPEKLRHWNRE